MASVTEPGKSAWRVPTDTIFCLDGTVDVLKSPIWVNVYWGPLAPWFGPIHGSREEADRKRAVGLIYRVKVTPRRSSWFS